MELAGGRLLAGSADLRSDVTETPEVTMRYARLALVLGLKVPRREVHRIFRSLDLEVVRRDAGAITVRLPSWRSDLGREIDLIEEVARFHGYDKIGETTEIPVTPVTLSLWEVTERRARRMLAGEGFDEVVTYSLIVPSALQLAQPWHQGPPIALRNPVSAERTHLRLTNMANLLLTKQFNQAHGTERVDLFELGRVYVPRAGDPAPEEKLCLSALTDRPDGLRVLKGLLENLRDELGVERAIEQVPQCAGPFDPGQGLVLRLDGSLLGCLGVLALAAARELDLRTVPALMELDFRLLAGHGKLDPPYRPVPAYPSTRRDMAVVVAEDVLWSAIERCIKSSAPDLLESVEFFDVYRGQPVPAGCKSVAFALTFRRQDGTITAAEAEQARAAVLAALQKELGATLR
jgi:phenylalanyl-tRNA synthetase beta chain